jgi:hypothetical protein
MAYSPRFKHLDTRVKELRKRFLPAQFSTTGAYGAEALDKARAFRMLVHAELESYFEERAIDIVDAAFHVWRVKGKPSIPIIHLFTGVSDVPGLPSKLGTNRTALSITGSVVASYKKNLNENHGIRIANLLQILLPIGVLEAEIDAAWIATTDGFGRKRGATAHKAAITYAIDPKDDFQTVNQIMSGVRDLDVLMNKIRARLR